MRLVTEHYLAGVKLTPSLLHGAHKWAETGRNVGF